MRGFRGTWGWAIGLPLAVLLSATARADNPQCRMECDAGTVTNVAEARLCLARCEVRLAALGNRGPTGTTAMPNPRTAWTVGPTMAGRAPSPAPVQVAARGTPGRTARAALPSALTTAMAQQAPPQPPGQGFMASVMGAQAATLPPGVTPTRSQAAPPGRRSN